ncbi:MAG: hypothetical protein ACXV2H_14725 [Actinomycetes bacterium]
MTDQGAAKEVPSWDETCAALAKDLRRAAERLRGLSQARLAAPAPPHATRAAAARATAQRLADAAQGVEERGAPQEPAWRTVPELSDFAAGDQVTLTGHDLLTAVAEVSADAPVGARGCRRTAREVLAAVASDVAELRRLL